MSFAVKGVSGSNTYQKSAMIEFFENDQGGLTVTIDTDRLHMRPVEASEKDYSSYAALYGDPEVMQNFHTGETKTREYIEGRIKNLWVNRWKNHDPYSAFAVSIKETDEFVGHAVLGHGDLPGEAELAGLSLKHHWGHGFASEAAVAIVKEYAPATVKEGYTTLDGKTLYRINATARSDNPASINMLKKLDMRKEREEEKFGALRSHFSLDLTV